MTTQDTSQREVNPWLHWVAPDGTLVPRTWESVANGQLPWSELDDDEIGKGKLRDANGQFRGANAIPRKLIPELTRRLKERYDDALRERLIEAQQVYFDVMADTSAGAADRLRAAAYVQERLIGKVPDKVEVVAEVKPWEGLIEGILADVPEDDGSAS